MEEEELNILKNNSSLRSKKSRKSIYVENNISRMKCQYSKTNSYEKELFNSPRRVENLSEDQIKNKKISNQKFYKKSKRNCTLNNSYHCTSLKLEWDYKNLCEL